MSDKVKAVWLVIVCAILNLAFVLYGAWISLDLVSWARYSASDEAMTSVTYVIVALAACYLALYSFASFKACVFIDARSEFADSLKLFFDAYLLWAPAFGLIVFDWIFGDIGLRKTDGLFDTFGMIYSFETLWAAAAAISLSMLVIFFATKVFELLYCNSRSADLGRTATNLARNQALTEALAALSSPGAAERLIRGFKRNTAVRQIKAQARRYKLRFLSLIVAAALFALMLFSAGAATESMRHGGSDEIIARNTSQDSEEEGAPLMPQDTFLIERDVLDAVSFSDFSESGLWLLKSDGTLWDGRNNTEVEQTKGMRFKDITCFDVPYITYGTAFAGLRADGTVFYYPEERFKEYGYSLYRGADVIALSGGFALRSDGTAVDMVRPYQIVTKQIYIDSLDVDSVPDFTVFLYDSEYYTAALESDGNVYVYHGGSWINGELIDDRWEQELAWIGSYRSIPVALTARGEVILGFDPDWSDGEESAYAPLKQLNDLPVYIYERARGYGPSAPGFAIYVRRRAGGSVDCLFSPADMRYLLR